MHSDGLLPVGLRNCQRVFAPVSHRPTHLGTHGCECPIIGSPLTSPIKKILPHGRQFTGKNSPCPGSRSGGRIFTGKLSAAEETFLEGTIL